MTPPPCVMLSPSAAIGVGEVTVKPFFADQSLKGAPSASTERTRQ